MVYRPFMTPPPSRLNKVQNTLVMCAREQAANLLPLNCLHFIYSARVDWSRAIGEVCIKHHYITIDIGLGCLTIATL